MVSDWAHKRYSEGDNERSRSIGQVQMVQPFVFEPRRPQATVRGFQHEVAAAGTGINCPSKPGIEPSSTDVRTFSTLSGKTTAFHIPTAVFWSKCYADVEMPIQSNLAHDQVLDYVPHPSLVALPVVLIAVTSGLSVRDIAEG